MNGKEHFEDVAAPVAPEQMIKKIYADLYERLPTPKELAFYLEYVKQTPDITYGKLADVIEASSSSLGAVTNTKGVEVPSDMIVTSTKQPEQLVIEAYGDILMRMPSPAELQKYTKMIRDDKTFTRERLVVILMATDEYMRTEKTQTNTVYSNLGGAVTDRQITMTIEEINKQVTGTSYVDPDTMRFYKRKFLELELDQVKFKVFLERYVMWTEDEEKIMEDIKTKGGSAARVSVASVQTSGVSLTSGVTSAATATKPPVAVAATETSKDTRNVDAASSTGGEEDAPGTYYNNSTIYNIYTVGDTDYMGAPNKAIINKLGQCAAKSGSTSDVIKNITCQNGPVTSKGGPQSSDYADYISQRNRQELQTTCARTSKFSAMSEDDAFADMFYTKAFTKEDMVLDPTLRWSVPQRHPPVCTPNERCDIKPQMEQTALIGTLLDDANNTAWGSILPPS
jgi:hypothetical protein